MFKNTKLTSTQQNERMLVSLTVLVFMFLFFLAVGGGFRAGYKVNASRAQDPEPVDVSNIIPLKLTITAVNANSIEVTNQQDGLTYNIQASPDFPIDRYITSGKETRFTVSTVSALSVGDSIDVLRGGGTDMKKRIIIPQKITLFK
jgi:hypothetical protein